MFEFSSVLNQQIEKFLSPILRLLYLRLKLTPNKLSVISFAIGSLSVFFIMLKKIEFALLLLLFALIFDVFDGALASYFKLESKRGKKLELIFDRTNEAMLFLSLAYIELANFKIAILAILAILLMTTLRDRAKFDPGFKRVILFLGYFLNNFQIALEIIFLVNLFGFVVNMLIIEYKQQSESDAKNLRL